MQAPAPVKKMADDWEGEGKKAFASDMDIYAKSITTDNDSPQKTYSSAIGGVHNMLYYLLLLIVAGTFAK
ncbi:hypothetical protein SARC_18120, partial [Sphaeroforma arctica JP610]